MFRCQIAEQSDADEVKFMLAYTEITVSLVVRLKEYWLAWLRCTQTEHDPVILAQSTRPTILIIMQKEAYTIVNKDISQNLI